MTYTGREGLKDLFTTATDGHWKYIFMFWVQVISILKTFLNLKAKSKWQNFIYYFSWKEMARKRIFQNVTIHCSQRNDAETLIEFKHQLLELNFFLTTILDLIEVPSC